jgi:hypothetical protein
MTIFLIVFTALMAWPKAHGEVIKNSHVGVVRRLVATYIDLFVGMLILMPSIFLFRLFFEAVFTGSWRWYVSDETLRPTDGLLILIVFGVYMSYFRYHLVRQKQTVGQHLMNFKLIALNPNASLFLRGFTALGTLSWWPFWPWTLFGKRQDYLWDRVSHIKARKVVRKHTLLDYTIGVGRK